MKSADHPGYCGPKWKCQGAWEGQGREAPTATRSYSSFSGLLIPYSCCTDCLSLPSTPRLLFPLTTLQAESFLQSLKDQAV